MEASDSEKALGEENLNLPSTGVNCPAVRRISIPVTRPAYGIGVRGSRRQAALKVGGYAPGSDDDGIFDGHHSSRRTVFS
jgi:hypothetical protein